MLIRVTDILLLSFSLYKEHFKLFAKYLGLLFIPTVFTRLSGEFVSLMFVQEKSAVLLNSLIATGYLILITIAFIFGYWITFAIVRTCADIYLKMQRKNIHDELGETKEYLWPALLTSILSTLVFAVWFSPIIARTGLDAIAFSQYLTDPVRLLTFVILLIPAIYFGLWYVFASYNVVIHKQESAIKAMKNSHNLVRGRWWSVLWRLAVPWAAFALLAYIPQKLLKVAQYYINGLLEAGTWEYLVTINVLALTFIITSLLFAPLVFFAKTILYVELRKVPTERMKRAQKLT